MGLDCGTNLTQVIYADDLTANYGTQDCRRIRRHIFSELSPIAGDLAAHYIKTAERSSFEQANHALIDIHDQLRIEDLNLCTDHEELLNAARRLSEKCYLAQHRAKTTLEGYQACLRIVDHYQIKRVRLKYNVKRD